MDKVILTTAAPLTDVVAMAKFLKPIPNGDRLGAILENRAPVSTRAYDDDTATARFVASDGIIAKCFTVVDVTIDQAEMIAAACEDAHAWTDATFREAVVAALGSVFDRDPPQRGE